MTTADAAPGRTPAAFRLVAGETLVMRQLERVIAQGCEQVLCLAESIGADVIALQHRAEAAGKRFVAVTDPRRLPALVTADDRVLIVQPGVVATATSWPDMARSPGVVTLPASVGIPLGFERIDVDRAWAGVALVPGAVVAELDHLSEEVDVASSLMRIALQSGVRCHALATDVVTDGRWLLDPDERGMAAFAAHWIGAHAHPAPFTAPGNAVVDRIGVRLAADILKGGFVALPASASLLALLAAALLVAAGWVVPAMAALAGAAILQRLGHILRRIAAGGTPATGAGVLMRIADRAIDPALVLGIAAASPEDGEWLRLFVPVVLFGLLDLGARSVPENWRPAMGDRVALAVLLVPAALVGWVQPVAAGLALAALAALVFAAHRAKLTRD